MAEGEFFVFSNPLFLDAFVAIVLYLVYRLGSKRFPRVSEGIKEASLMFLVFMCYDASRYFALDEQSKAVRNAYLVIGFENKTHLDFEIPMQKFAVAHVQFAKFLNKFYLAAHWGGLVIFFVWAYSRVIFGSPNKMVRRRMEYVQARGRFIIMNILAAISFMAFPCAPPRAIPGYVDTMAAISNYDVYSSTRRWVNPYAAMPSMHQGYSLLFAVTIVIMLRSEILASGVEPDEDDADSEKLAPPKSRLRALLSLVMRRYNQYHVLSVATRRDASKLFYLSLIPFVFLLYPAFMFVVIVSTGNHFVLDAVAGATAMGLAALAYPLVLRAVLWVEGTVIKRASDALTRMSARILGEKIDIEMGDYKMEKVKEEEKKGFLSAAETA